MDILFYFKDHLSFNCSSRFQLICLEALQYYALSPSLARSDYIIHLHQAELFPILSNLYSNASGNSLDNMDEEDEEGQDDVDSEDEQQYPPPLSGMLGSSQTTLSFEQSNPHGNLARYSHNQGSLREKVISRLVSILKTVFPVQLENAVVHSQNEAMMFRDFNGIGIAKPALESQDTVGELSSLFLDLSPAKSK